MTATFPASALQSTVQSLLSQRTPQLSPVSSLMLRCSLVSSPYAIPSDIIHSFSLGGTGFGEMFSAAIGAPSWQDIYDGSYTDFTVIRFLPEYLGGSTSRTLLC
jgi:hypothetical protein